MNLTYAVDRLYEVGWLPASGLELERLNDGRHYPAVSAVQKLFAEAGLELSIKQDAKFKCYQAAWGPKGESLDPRRPGDERHGTVVGSCQREASVYALAQFLATQTEAQLTPA